VNREERSVVGRFDKRIRSKSKYQVHGGSGEGGVTSGEEEKTKWARGVGGWGGWDEYFVLDQGIVGIQ